MPLWTHRDRGLVLFCTTRGRLLCGVWFHHAQLSDGVARIFEELHLRQSCAERVRGRGDGGDRGVARVLGGLPHLLCRLSKALPRLSDRFHLLAVMLAKRT